MTSGILWRRNLARTVGLRSTTGILCSHCLRRIGRWHSLLQRVAICSPPPLPLDWDAIRAATNATGMVAFAAGAYRDNRTEDNWQALRSAVDHQRASTEAARAAHSPRINPRREMPSV